MLSRISKRTWFTAFALIAVMLFLSGCSSATHPVSMDHLQHGNFWQRNVVYYFSLSTWKISQNGSAASMASRFC